VEEHRGEAPPKEQPKAPAFRPESFTISARAQKTNAPESKPWDHIFGHILVGANNPMYVIKTRDYPDGCYWGSAVSELESIGATAFPYEFIPEEQLVDSNLHAIHLFMLPGVKGFVGFWDAPGEIKISATPTAQPISGDYQVLLAAPGAVAVLTGQELIVVKNPRKPHARRRNLRRLYNAENITSPSQVGLDTASLGGRPGVRVIFPSGRQVFAPLNGGALRPLPQSKKTKSPIYSVPKKGANNNPPIPSPLPEEDDDDPYPGTG
jgi:hypothetical protein